MTHKQTEINRRQMLKKIALSGLAAGVVTSVCANEKVINEQNNVVIDNKGYRMTEHIHAYYKSLET